MSTPLRPAIKFYFQRIDSGFALQLNAIYSDLDNWVILSVLLCFFKTNLQQAFRNIYSRLSSCSTARGLIPGYPWEVPLRLRFESLLYSLKVPLKLVLVFNGIYSRIIKCTRYFF